MSKLLYKPDWDAVKEQFKKWWDRKKTDIPFIAIRAPKDNPLPCKNLPSKPASLELIWTDFDYTYGLFEKELATQSYYGMRYPNTTATLGPGSVGTFLGSKPEFMPDTVWYEPCFKDISKAFAKFDPKNKWWQWTLDWIKKAVSKADNKYLVSFPDLIENLDTLSALLGNEELLVYLLDAPGEIHRLQKELSKAWFKFYDSLYNIIKDKDNSSSFAYFDIWGPGRVCKLQCDISAAISPAMFDEFVMPYLKEQIDGLDHTLYHLDGPDAVKHLDLLLSIEALDAIQWVSGAGHPDPADDCWDFIHRKILDAGKGVHINVDPLGLKNFMRKFGRQNIYYILWTSTEKEALQILEESKNW